MRRHPVVDVVNFLEVLVPVDEELVVIPNSSTGLLSTSPARHSIEVLDVLLLAVTADDVPLLIDVPEQLAARVEARVASTACRLVPTVDLSSTFSLRVDHVLLGVFVLGEDVVDVRSELHVGLFLLLDPWDFQP